MGTHSEGCEENPNGVVQQVELSLQNIAETQYIRASQTIKDVIVSVVVRCVLISE